MGVPSSSSSATTVPISANSTTSTSASAAAAAAQHVVGEISNLYLRNRSPYSEPAADIENNRCSNTTDNNLLLDDNNDKERPHSSPRWNYLMVWFHWIKTALLVPTTSTTATKTTATPATNKSTTVKVRKKKKMLNYLCYIFFALMTLGAILWIVDYLFNPVTSGVGNMYLRSSFQFISASQAQSLPLLPASTKTCVMQSFNQQGKERFQAYVERNKQWALAQGYSFHEYTQQQYEQEHPGLNEKPHFFKFHAIHHLFSDSAEHDCDYVMYMDTDAVVTFPPNNSSNSSNLKSYYPIPNYASASPGLDIIFGNEVFAAAFWAMDEVNYNTNNNNNPQESSTTLPFNSGFLLIRKTDFSKQFVQDVLTHSRCNACRYDSCTIFRFYDQGCMEKLVTHEYSDYHSKFGVAQVQHLQPTPGYWMCHLAGINKHDGNTLDSCLVDSNGGGGGDASVSPTQQHQQQQGQELHRQPATPQGFFAQLLQLGTHLKLYFKDLL